MYFKQHPRPSTFSALYCMTIKPRNGIYSCLEQNSKCAGILLRTKRPDGSRKRVLEYHCTRSLPEVGERGNGRMSESSGIGT